MTNTTQTPLILAAETSGRMGSVALAQGPQLLAEQAFSQPMRHSAELFPAIKRLLDRFGHKAAEIQHVYISVGPGSFTGLRIAVALAKAFALANAARIVAVDTLDCLAANVSDYLGENATSEISRIATILDAKRSQFFIAVYENPPRDGLRQTQDTRPQTEDRRPKTKDAIWRKILPDCLMTTEQFLKQFANPDNPIRLLGEGLVYYKNKFINPAVCFLDEKYWTPTARNVHRVGWRLAQQGLFTDPVTLVPNYLRVPDVKTKEP